MHLSRIFIRALRSDINPKTPSPIRGSLSAAAGGVDDKYCGGGIGRRRSVTRASTNSVSELPCRVQIPARSTTKRLMGRFAAVAA
jgi:hypothetical protein